MVELLTRDRGNVELEIKRRYSTIIKFIDYIINT